MIEIFNLFKTKFIHSPTILTYLNNPIGQIKVVTISILQMILTYYNNKWQHCSTIKIDILNYNDPFLITRLYNFNFLIPVVQYYNKNGYNLTYKKTYFIKIPDIGFYNIIFNNYILKKSKPNSNDL